MLMCHDTEPPPRIVIPPRAAARSVGPVQPQMAGNAGDYAGEDAIEQLMAQLFQQGDGDQGPPPVSSPDCRCLPLPHSPPVHQ